MFNYLGKPTKEQKKITEELIKRLPKDKKYIINFTDDFSKTYKGGELKLNTEDYEKVKIRGMIGGAGGWVDDVFEIKINTKLPLYELRETLAHELGHSFYKEAPEKLFNTNQTSGNQFNFQEMGKKIVSRDEVVADHFADYLLNNKKYSEIYPDENKFFNKILVNNMPKYINTAKNEFYDLTDPNAPKLIGNMTDYAKTLAEKNFAGYKAGFENPASADLEKNWFIQRESGKIYQDLLRQTEFRDLTPTAPAPQAPVVKSGFDITPGQASQKQTDLYNAGEGEYAPTFKAAVAESGTAAINAPQIAQIGGQAPYFYGADVLGKKANDAAVNTLYRAYFGRDASAAELKNWGASGGADTTVKSLEDFLKSEQIKYNVPQGIKTLTPESFKPTATAVLPTGNLVDTAPQANALVAGAQTNLKEIMASLTPPETEADKKEQSLLDMMASLTGEQGQKAADQLTAEQSAGLPDLKKQFADINAQILTKAAEYNVLSTANQNKPITMASIIGQERAIMNAKAADIGLLQARAQGLQGQISVAQETVNRAIDLKYSTIEAQLNTYEAQLKALMPTLNKEEKIRAEARQMMIDNQKQALSDQKDKEKEINKLALSGYNYVSTPAERDRLKAQGYEIIQQSGRTYAKAPEIKAVKTRAAGGGGGGGGSDISGGDISTGGANGLINSSVDIGKMSKEAQAVLSGTLRLEDLTPSVKGRISGELTAAGYKSQPKLSTAQQEDLATMKTVSNLVDDVLAYNSDGKLEGIGAFGLGSLKSGLAQLGFGSEEGKSVRVLMGNIKGTVAKLRGGTSFTPNEEKLLNSYTPSVNDSPGVAINKLNLLKDFIATKEINLRAYSQDRILPAANKSLESAKSKYNISY